MKKYQINLFFVLAVIWSIDLSGQTANFKESIPKIELQADFEILKSVFKNYHPGLYRYQDSMTIEHHFEELYKELDRDLSTTEFYLILSKFTAKLKCGHTFCSYYNQKKEIQDSLFNKSDKLPFTFSLFEKQMIIDKDLSRHEIKKGMQITSINQVPVTSIIDSLLLYTKGDGSNNAKRFVDLELSGLGKYETFDIYFPLLFPSINSTYELELKGMGSNEIKKIKVKSISRAERFDLIEQKYGKQSSTFDELWSFEILNEKMGYLKIGTFVTYKMTIDWKVFLGDVFQQLKTKNIPNLIIDIRGNEGGDDEVNLVLAKYLASKPIKLMKFNELLKYEKVSPELKPFLKTWDKSFYNRTGKVIKLDNGFYTWKENNIPKVIEKNKKAYTGKVVLLVNGTNSSATFFLTSLLQENKIAKVIGTETGGNRKGTNGGNLFFLRLPNSKIEIDVPLIGYYPLTEQPDKGLTPDIEIKIEIEDIINKKDVVFEKAIEFIQMN